MYLVLHTFFQQGIASEPLFPILKGEERGGSRPGSRGGSARNSPRPRVSPMPKPDTPQPETSSEPQPGTSAEGDQVKREEDPVKTESGEDEEDEEGWVAFSNSCL